MSIFDRIVEKKIQEAMEAGEFDNLAGKGKPLHLDDNPYEPEEWRTAFRMLKNNGLTLEWMDLRKEIEADRESARQRFQQRWEDAESERERAGAKAEFIVAISSLNRKIFGYNVRVPSPVFELRSLDAQAEIQSVLKTG